MNIIGLLALVSVSLHGCNSAGGESKAADQKITADTTKVSTPPIPFFNGVTDANKGIKRGPIQVKGTMPSPAMLYLYEMEGRTNVKIDSVNSQGGKFDFGTNNLESGLYNIGINDQNMVQVILNPSEPVVEINFRTLKLDNAPIAVNSKENEAWFRFHPQETVLLKQIKDNIVAQHKSAVKDKYNQII